MMATEDMRERLAQLPHHAGVAFAARCARRVQPLTHARPQQGRDAIDRAIASAEACAKGTAAAAADDAAARADATRADAARADAEADAAAGAAVAARAGVAAAWADAADEARADAAGAAAAWAADAARVAGADAAGDAAAWAAAASDIDRLIALKRSEPDTLGAPIDPSEAGPLGPLWPHGVPQWYTEAATGTGTPHEGPSGDTD
jgi:hypothetical protein